MARLGSITSATDITAGGGGASQALMETRTAAAAATIDVSVKSLRTAGYAAPGDGGHGLYKRVNAQPAHAGYFRSTDRFLADGTTNSTNGGYWELVPEAGSVRIEQFGGKADSDGAGGGTDNLAPLIAATTMISFQALQTRVAYKTLFGAGRYRFSDTFWCYTTVFIEGVNIKHEVERTVFDLPGNKDWFVFHGINTGPGPGLAGTNGGEANSSTYHFGAAGSTLRNIMLQGPAGWPVDATKTAIFARTSIGVENVDIRRAPGKGIWLRGHNASANVNELGDANQFYISRVDVNSCHGDGLHLQGKDVNAGEVSGFTTSHCDGCGIRNEASYASSFTGLHIAGYGNVGVGHGGFHYILIKTNPADTLGGAVTPGTDGTVWYLVKSGAAGGQYPAWVPGGVYVLTRPIWDAGEAGTMGTGSVYTAPYIEVGGAGHSHVLPVSLVVGGTIAMTKQSSALTPNINNQPIYSNYYGIGGQRRHDETGDPAALQWGTFQSAAIGTYGDLQLGGMTILEHGTGREEGVYRWSYHALEPDYTTYSFGGPGSGASNKAIWRVYGRTSTERFNRPATPVPDMFAVQQMAWFDPAGTPQARIHGMLQATPTPGNAMGEAAVGEVRWNAFPAAGGNVGWVCVQTGVLCDTFAAGANGYSLPIGFYTSNAGNFYKLKSKVSGNASVAPTHTSGDNVAGADTYVWTWITNTAAVWKTFGTIAS